MIVKNGHKGVTLHQRQADELYKTFMICGTAVALAFTVL